MSAVNKAGRRRRTAADMARLERGEAAAPKPTFCIPLKPHVSAELADGHNLSKVLHQVCTRRRVRRVSHSHVDSSLTLSRTEYARRTPTDAQRLPRHALSLGRDVKAHRAERALLLSCWVVFGPLSYAACGVLTGVRHQATGEYGCHAH